MLIKFEDDSKLGDATNTTGNREVMVQVKGIHEQNYHQIILKDNKLVK